MEGLMTTYKEEAEHCLKQEDKIGCVKEIPLRHKDDKCAPKLVLLIQPDCIPCKKALTELAEAIESGLVKKLDFNSVEGAEIIKKNAIVGIPELLLLDCHNKAIL